MKFTGIAVKKYDNYILPEVNLGHHNNMNNQYSKVQQYLCTH
jgi:hypothetical protein